MSIQDSWPKDVLRPREIESQEQLIRMFLKDSDRPSRPILMNTLVIKKETLAFLWLSENDKQRYLFPISKPSCREFEYSNLSEWDIIFIGSAEQLMATELTRQFENFSIGSDNGLFCLLAINHYMRGFDDEDISSMIFPCCVVSRIEKGRLIEPKIFCNERWQPTTRDEPLIIDEVFAGCLDHH